MKGGLIRICGRAAALVILASLLGLAFNAVSPKGVDLLKEPPKPTSTAWKDITVDGAKALLGVATFVDARSKEDYEAGHILGAVSLPLYDFENQINDFIMKVPSALELVIYCGGGDCELSHKLAERLAQANYRSIHVLSEGITGWKAKNLPTAKGSQ